MGKRIDRAALGALAAVGFYLFVLNAWGSIPLACATAFAACALARYLAKGLRLPSRATPSQARAEILRIAGLPDREAEEVLAGLVRARFPDEAFVLTAVLKHPEASLSSGDILNAWKANRSAERLVIAATCPCEPRAVLYARELRAPAVAVMDSRALIRLLRAPGVGDTLARAPRQTPRQWLRRAVARFHFARVSPGDALLSAALLALYMFRGNPFSLFGALALLLRLCLVLSRRRGGRRLFD